MENIFVQDSWFNPLFSRSSYHSNHAIVLFYSIGNFQ